MPKTNNVKPERSREWVSATVLENMWAGVGSGIVSFVFQTALSLFFGVESSDMALLSLLASLAMFGVLCIVRFTTDELNIVWDVYEQRAASALIDRLQSTVAEQQSTIRRLERENRGQRFTEASKDAREAVSAEKPDALRVALDEIIGRWQQDVSYARSSCTISKSDWATAMRLLFRLNLVEKSGPGGRQWVFVDGISVDEVNTRIREHYQRLELTENTNFVLA